MVVDDEGVASARLAEVGDVLHQVGQMQVQTQQQQQTPSVITDSDLPSGRSNTYFQPPHNGLVFSPGRRAQLSRQQLSWMQALAKNSINTPPSLRNAQLVHELSLYGGSMASADTDAENDATARDDVSTADVEAVGRWIIW